MMRSSATIGIWSHRCPVFQGFVDAPEWAKSCFHCKVKRPELVDGRKPREYKDIFRGMDFVVKGRPNFPKQESL